MKSQGYGDHSQEICAWSASSFGTLRQFQGRIEATTYEQAWHYPFPERLVAPTGFALKDCDMRKGFTRKPQGGEPATRGKNYITPSGLQRLKDEHRFLLTRERPAVTKVVAWAASNGDRSENADYQYGKRRLRQIDGRIRFLTKRIDAAEVVDPESPRAGQAATRAFFGATVRYANAAGTERVVSIVGTDEVDLNRNHVSWVSPLGRALMKSAAGDRVALQAPRGTEYLTVLGVCYERISVEPFRESPGAEASAKGLPRRRQST
jgi:transcription elongation factor GreB